MRATNRPRCRKVAVKSWRRGQLHGRRIAAGQLTRVPGQSVPADEQRYKKHSGSPCHASQPPRGLRCCLKFDFFGPSSGPLRGRENIVMSFHYGRAHRVRSARCAGAEGP